MHENRFKNQKFDVPLCRFGPGGEYVKDFEGLGAADDKNRGSLRGLLLSLAEIAGAAVNPELLEEMVEGPVDVPDSKQGVTFKEKTEIVSKKTNKRNSKTDGGFGKHSKIPTQQMLFSDDIGISTAGKSKPKYHIRTRRRTSQKRSDMRIPGQGSLFETDQKRGSAA